MKIVSALQMRRVDEQMIRDFGISETLLMEKAGSAVAGCVREVIEREGWSHGAVLFAGRGNNGGDAFVAARLLEEHGIKSRTLLLAAADQVKGAAQESLKKLRARGGAVVEIKTAGDLRKSLEPLHDFPVAVDGIVGTGSKGPLSGLLADAAEIINSDIFAYVVAIDIPSGLNPDKGTAEGVCVRADETVTMGLPKTGLIIHDGLEWTGRIAVTDFGIPEPILKSIPCDQYLIHALDVPVPARRRRLSHKGDYGHLLILGGSPGFTGAPAMAALAALRSGCGLVTVGAASSMNAILEAKLTEPMTLPLPEDAPGILGMKALDAVMRFLERCDALVMGPGLGTHESTVRLVHEILKRVRVPAVIDADGLNALARDPAVLREVTSPVILTPHPGEMSRLVNRPKDEVQAKRWTLARDFARSSNAVTVLKGAGTVVALPDGTIHLNVTGHPGMATGGMGDILSGLIGGLLCQRMSPADSAKLGIYLHGAAADHLSRTRRFHQGLLATDLLEPIPVLVRQMQSQRVICASGH